MMSVMLRTAAIFIVLSVVCFFLYIHSRKMMDENKSILIGGIVALILAIALPLSGLAIYKNCNGCGYEYLKYNMPDYCEKCGHALTADAAEKFECSCGAVYYSDGGEKFCTECGSEIVYEIGKRAGNGTN